MWYKNIAGKFFGLVTKHACDRRTDRRTDGQNYDSHHPASIAALCGNNNHSGTVSVHFRHASVLMIHNGSEFVVFRYTKIAQ